MCFYEIYIKLAISNLNVKPPAFLLSQADS